MVLKNPPFKSCERIYTIGFFSFSGGIPSVQWGVSFSTVGGGGGGGRGITSVLWRLLSTVEIKI